MDLRSAHNYKHKQQQQHALIELVIMPILLMDLQQHIQLLQDVKHIYQHAIGMELQDAQVEDAQHILVYKQLALPSQLQDNLAGHFLLLVLMLHA